MRWLNVFYLLFYSSMLLGQPEEIVRSPAEQELYLILEEYYETMSDRDWIAYRDFFVAGGTLTTVWKAESEAKPAIHTYSIDQFLAQTKDGPDSQPIFEEKMTSADMKIQGNLASVFVRYKAKFGTSENLMEWEGFDHFSMIRFEGKWKIVSITYESDF